MLLEQIIEKSNKATIINVPLKNWMNNVIVANNPHEAHQAIWEENDLNEIASRMDVNLEKVIWKQNNRCGCLGIFKK